jgi:hypothetical protein
MRGARRRKREKKKMFDQQFHLLRRYIRRKEGRPKLHTTVRLRYWLDKQEVEINEERENLSSPNELKVNK